jgi:hypothetical protein
MHAGHGHLTRDSLVIFLEKRRWGEYVAIYSMMDLYQCQERTKSSGDGVVDAGKSEIDGNDFQGADATQTAAA